MDTDGIDICTLMGSQSVCHWCDDHAPSPWAIRRCDICNLTPRTSMVENVFSRVFCKPVSTDVKNEAG